MDHIKDELSHLGGMSSNDAFDLLTLGLFPDEEPEEPKADPEEEKPTGDEGEQPEDDEQKAARVLDRLIDLTIN